MASSRLEKIGTIFSRVTGLLKSGAMKPEDKPLWYDVYKAFPPKYEPRYDRPVPDIPVKEILYTEDEIRAKFHKDHKYMVNLADKKNQTACQKFIAIYNSLKAEGTTPEDNLYSAALDVFKAQGQVSREKLSSDKVPSGAEMQTSFVSSFQEAQRKENVSESNINIKDIFKE